MTAGHVTDLWRTHKIHMGLGRHTAERQVLTEEDLVQEAEDAEDGRYFDAGSTLWQQA